MKKKKTSTVEFLQNDFQCTELFLISYDKIFVHKCGFKLDHSDSFDRCVIIFIFWKVWKNITEVDRNSFRFSLTWKRMKFIYQKRNLLAYIIYEYMHVIRMVPAKNDSGPWSQQASPSVIHSFGDGRTFSVHYQLSTNYTDIFIPRSHSPFYPNLRGPTLFRFILSCCCVLWLVWMNVMYFHQDNCYLYEHNIN